MRFLFCIRWLIVPLGILETQYRAKESVPQQQKLPAQEEY